MASELSRPHRGAQPSGVLTREGLAHKERRRNALEASAVELPKRMTRLRSSSSRKQPGIHRGEDVHSKRSTRPLPVHGGDTCLAVASNPTQVSKAHLRNLGFRHSQGASGLETRPSLRRAGEACFVPPLSASAAGSRSRIQNRLLPALLSAALRGQRTPIDPSVVSRLAGYFGCTSTLERYSKCPPDSPAAPGEDGNGGRERQCGTNL